MLHDGLPLGPQAGPLLVGQQRVEGAHAAGVIIPGGPEGNRGQSEDQQEGQGKSERETHVNHYSTVTLLARFLGWSTSLPRYTAIS